VSLYCEHGGSIQYPSAIIVTGVLIIMGPYNELEHRRIWENNIRMNLKMIGSEVVYWIHLAQDRDKLQALVNAVVYLRVP